MTLLARILSDLSVFLSALCEDDLIFLTENAEVFAETGELTSNLQNLQNLHFHTKPAKYVISCKICKVRQTLQNRL